MVVLDQKNQLSILLLGLALGAKTISHGHSTLSKAVMTITLVGLSLAVQIERSMIPVEEFDERCSTCKYVRRDREYLYICNNADSDYYTDFTEEDWCCDCYEPRGV